ncbi:MAG TPA: hypothetical protein VE643_02980 [Nitrososphaeraceae archaeon]|nr:hypothetical protein [Nitrososphaeraceae archaeon]
MKPSYNIAANASYSSKVLQNLANKVLERGMDFPNFIGDRHIKSSKKKNRNKEQQTTLVTYM